MSAPTISIVVVSAGRPRALARCLTGLWQLRGTTHEVIVVADDEGRDVAATLPFSHSLRILAQERPNIAAARNTGIRAAAGDIVAFIDDDAVPEPTWAEALRAGFADTSMGAMTGPVLGRNGISLQWGRMSIDPLGKDHWLRDAAEPDPGAALKLHGTNMAVRRDVLVALGGFDEAFSFYLDDTDLALRLTGAGYRAVYDPAMVVHHSFMQSARRTTDRVPLSLFDIGASTAVFLRKHAAASSMPTELAALEDAQRRRLLRLAKRRRLGSRDMRHLMESLLEGIEAGRIRSPAPGVVGDAPERLSPLRSVDIGPMQVFSGWRWALPRLRAAAADAVTAGQAATVIALEPTPRKMRVEFSEGGWWEHRGGLFGPADRSEPRVQFWHRDARILRETARVAEIRGIHR